MNVLLLYLTTQVLLEFAICYSYIHPHYRAHAWLRHLTRRRSPTAYNCRERKGHAKAFLAFLCRISILRACRSPHLRGVTSFE